MVIHTLIIVEILFVNLLVTHFVLTKKYSVLKIVTYLVLFTFIYVVAAYFAQNFNRPPWFNIVIGITYVFPLYYLYKESLLKITTLMLFSWTQTMIILGFSISIAGFFDQDQLFIFIVQTILFIGLTPFILIFARNTYKPIIDDIENDSSAIMVSTVALIFLATVGITYSTVIKPFWMLVDFILVLIISLLIYTLLKRYVDKSNNIFSLNKLAYMDNLTKIGNRYALFAQSNALISKKIAFELIFMDLDDLKSINDTYGHPVGDDYIISFTEAVSQSINTEDSVYRVSGDEFVCIIKSSKIDLGLFSKNISKNYRFKYIFNGVSLGLSKFPDDGTTLDELLVEADKKMYLRKQIKK